MRTLLATAAFAMLVTPVFAGDHKWDGGYAGGFIGYGSLDATHRQTNGGMDPSPFSADDSNALAGVLLGYNRQIGSLVIGAELEGGYMNIEGEGRIPSSTPPNYQRIDVDTGLYGLAAARLGFAFDRTLIYAKGGYAIFDGDVGQTTTKAGYETHRSDNLQGFVYGAGLEHMLSENVSVRLEWLRFDLDGVDGFQKSITDDPVGFEYKNATDADIDTFKLGINFKF